MSLEELYYVSQIIASVAVLASLIYLALQTRQTARNQQAAIAQARTESVVSVNLALSNPDTARMFARGVGVADDLSPSELQQFLSVFNAVMSNVENAFLQHKSGLLTDAAYETPKQGARLVMAQKGFRAAWRLRREFYSSEFRAYIDGVIRDTPVGGRGDFLQQFKLAAVADENPPQPSPAA
jgi:hypothetical protein